MSLYFLFPSIFRFENFVTVQLQRAIASWNERGKGTFTLYFLRTKDGKEVDFAIADRSRIWLLVETKEAEKSPSKSLRSLQEKLRAALAIQVINKMGFCEQKGKNLYVMGAGRFLSLLP